MATFHPDDPAAVPELPLGGTAHGVLDSTDEYDWFRVELKADHGYYLTPRMANGAVPFIYAAWSAIDYVDYTNEPGGLSSNELVNPFIPSTSGTFYLKLGKGQAGSYTLGLHEAADDAPNGVGAARPLTAAAPVAGRFDYAFDIDWFQIAAVAGVTYTVTVKSDSGSLGSASFIRLAQESPLFKGSEGGATTSYRFTADYTGNYRVAASLGSYDPPAAGGLAYHISVSEQDLTGPAVVKGAGTVDGPIVVTLSEAAQLGSIGTIELRNSYGGLSYTWEAGDPRIHVAGNTLTLTPSGDGVLVPGKYDLSLSGNVLADASGNIGRGTFYYAVEVQGTAGGGAALYGYGNGSHRQGTDSAADAVVYAGGRQHYTITRGADGFEVLSNGSHRPDTLAGIERVLFTQGAEVVALSLDGHLGQAFRLYTAAFGRTPDGGGLGYWLQVAERGADIGDMARGFIGSREFGDLYGAAPDDAAFVDALYDNVLHREGEKEGVDYWMGRLAHGADRGDVLAAFSESAENVQQAVALIGNGIVYTPYG